MVRREDEDVLSQPVLSVKTREGDGSNRTHAGAGQSNAMSLPECMFLLLPPSEVEDAPSCSKTSAKRCKHSPEKKSEKSSYVPSVLLSLINRRHCPAWRASSRHNTELARIQLTSS